MYALHQWNGDEYASKASNVIAGLINSAVAKNGACMIGLSGGSTPGTVYAELGRRSDIDWANVTVFLIDERYVPADDDYSNLKLIRSTLLKDAAVPPDNVIAPDTSLPLPMCVADYDHELHNILDSRPADIVILGLGADGHTASLFPGDAAAINEVNHLAIHTTTDQFDVSERISVTVPVLKNALHPLLLITGKKKLSVLDEMEKSDGHIRWPLKAIGDVTVLAQR